MHLNANIQNVNIWPLKYHYFVVYLSKNTGNAMLPVLLIGLSLAPWSPCFSLHTRSATQCLWSRAPHPLQWYPWPMRPVNSFWHATQTLPGILVSTRSWPEAWFSDGYNRSILVRRALNQRSNSILDLAIRMIGCEVRFNLLNILQEYKIKI